MSSDRAITTEGRPTPEILRELPIAELVAHVREGDEQETSAAFVEIARRFEPLLRKTWSLHGRGEYADFVHDVFARTFAALPSLNAAVAFPAFFRSIVLNVAADQWRRRALPESDLEAGSLEDLPSEVDDLLLTGILVRSYLEHLGERERRVVEWDVIEGYSAAEIAGRLGLTPGAVRMTKSRALEKLREIFSREARMIERLQKK